MRWLIRTICLGVVRLFYAQIEVTSRERFPTDAPVILVANHPNGLMDPIVIQLCLDRPVSFLAKSTLFTNPFGRVAMEAFNALPVYRRRDGEDTSQNAALFEACEETLASGGAIVLFPEGTSHSDPRLRPLKTGAARIALGAVRDRGVDDLLIMPVGLLYEAKELFRSRVGVAAGEPVRVADFLEAYEADERAAVNELTSYVADRMRDVVLEADDGELWEGLIATARATDPRAAADVAACDRRARELSDAYARLIENDPDAAERLREETRHYVRMLDSLGFAHPFLLEDAPTKANVIFRATVLILLSPLAAIGAILGYPTYKMLGPLSRKLAGEDRDLVSTIKTIGGVVFLPLTFVVEGLVAAYFFGWPAFFVVLLAGFLFGRLALWWFEEVAMTTEAVSNWWLRMSSKHTAEEVLRRRDELVTEFEERLDTQKQRPDPRREGQAVVR